eukprot:TRINITY_DN9802_c0_g1_i1.p1 TRINITY_DN9802_c0_g1~~TRINITY_DN9802_c0_g1_i1.p1  ORF type:complete len:106 (-),score=12.68 TRINITY_DN9802_c0_g1_i1:213-530(-)
MRSGACNCNTSCPTDSEGRRTCLSNPRPQVNTHELIDHLKSEKSKYIGMSYSEAEKQLMQLFPRAFIQKLGIDEVWRPIKISIDRLVFIRVESDVVVSVSSYDNE